MAHRIPQSEIDRLKQTVPLLDLCRKYGVEMKRHGSKDHIGFCPFHEEKTPSFIVTPKTNLFHCFGCDCGGSNFDLVMRMEKVSFPRAFEILSAHAGEAPPAATLRTRQGTSHTILASPEENLSDADLMRRVVELYHTTFMNRPSAMQYLQSRGCFHPEAVKKFSLGYANRTLGYRVPATTADGKVLKARLQKLGVLRESGHEHLNGCVIFPITNRSREIVEMYGRRITKTLPDVCPHLYLPGPHAGVWNDEELAASRTWIICEAALDALSWWCAGFRNVTWTYGVHGMSPDHWALIRETRPAKVILSQDNDEAGNKGAHGIAQQLEAEGIEAWRVLPPPGRDINDVVRGSKTAKDDLTALLATAARLLPGTSKVIVPSAEPEAPVELNAPAQPDAPAHLFSQSPSLLENQAPAAPTVTGRAATEEKSIPLAAASAAPSAADAPIFTTADRAIIMTCGEPLGPELVAKGRAWRIVGLENNTTYDRLKVNVRLSYRKAVHLDTFDLCLWRERKGFAAVAAQVTGIEAATAEADLAALVEHLQTLQQERLIAALKPVAAKAGVVISPDQESEAMAILKNPRMLDRVLSDLHKCGIVGEDKNLLISWLVSISRKLEKPLGICVMSRSAAGKSSLLDAVARFVPDEDKHQYTALTPQALFHMPENELVHKAIFIAEDVGAEGAAYSLKTIQSDGQLVIACTMKDEVSGQMVTKTKLVRGPVAVFLTSTNRSVDDELLNRLLLLTIDESMEQTERIHAAQRRAQTMQGIMERRMRPAIIALQQNLQRLIRPLIVKNEFEDELKRFYRSKLRSRRDYQKYIDLINTIALAHQYQREIKSAVDPTGATFQYIEATHEDIAIADDLLKDIMEQSVDERTPASKKMLEILTAWNEELPLNQPRPYRWTRREIRERTGWSDTQVRMVLGQLVDLEYLVQIGQGGRGNLVRYQLTDDDYFNPPNKNAEFAVSSQSSKCELSARASSLVAAANKNKAASSHRSPEGKRNGAGRKSSSS
jgi:DNA primase catalytic core